MFRSIRALIATADGLAGLSVLRRNHFKGLNIDLHISFAKAVNLDPRNKEAAEIGLRCLVDVRNVGFVESRIVRLSVEDSSGYTIGECRFDDGNLPPGHHIQREFDFALPWIEKTQLGDCRFFATVVDGRGRSVKSASATLNRDDVRRINGGLPPEPPPR